MRSLETQNTETDAREQIELAPGKFFSPEGVEKVAVSLARLEPFVHVQSLEVR